LTLVDVERRVAEVLLEVMERVERGVLGGVNVLRRESSMRERASETAGSVSGLNWYVSSPCGSTFGGAGWVVCVIVVTAVL